MVSQNKDNIKFYILVPVYKTEEYIHACIRSVLEQTYGSFEAIFVDDGSPDRAGIICDEYAAMDSRIHVIHQKNEGQLSARSAAIAYVRKNCSQENAFYLFLDSDDTIQENALEVLAKTISENECDMVVYGMQRVCKGNVIQGIHQDSYVRTVISKRELYKKVFTDNNYNALWRKTVKCDLMQSEDYSEYYHIRHGEDLLHSISVYKKCRKVVFIPDILYNYTLNYQSVTQSVSYLNYSVDPTVRAVVWQFLQEENCFTETDTEEYLGYCRKMLIGKVCQICGFPIDKERIYALLEEIRSDTYYSMLLRTRNSNKLLYLLREGKYTRLYYFAKVRNILKRIYRTLKLN